MSRVLRKYQIELANKALATNIIIWLGTGSGKTIIAALVIKKVLGQLLSEENVLLPYNLDGTLTIENVFNLNFTFDSDNLNVLERLESNESTDSTLSVVINSDKNDEILKSSIDNDILTYKQYSKKVIFLAPAISLAEQQSTVFNHIKY